jgi:arsenate reductase (thioredoxin)
MRKQKILFLCTQNSARSQMAEAFLRHHARDRFEAHSAGCDAADEIHPYVEEVMREVGIDTSGQRPQGLRTYMGKVGFNYSIIVCARAEKNCPKTFPGVGTRLVWIFDDPRGEDVPEEERLNKFRKIRDEVEQKMLDWLEHPESELEKLRQERQREREERLRAAREARSYRVTIPAEEQVDGASLGAAARSPLAV